MNKTLSLFGMRLTTVARDFEQFPLSETIQKSFFRDLAACADRWLTEQKCFDAGAFDTEEWVKHFYLAYLESPFRQQFGGSRFNNMLWLSLLSRAYNPAVIIDSGTFMGASAWALSLGAPSAKVWSFDIDLSQIEKRTPGVHYVEQDWTEFDFGTDAGTRSLIYFDDHVDQARRLLETYERGIGLAIFDDDFPVVPALAMANGGRSFPKIEFVLSDELRIEQEIVWSSGRRSWRWPVDTAYLDRARDVIAVTDRLPNTSSITGIHQTPYRIVKLKPMHRLA